MKKTFEVMYKGHHIRVENGWFSGERLYIDNELQDENIGLGFRGKLSGELKDGRGIIKVTIGGNFKISCKIFIDNNLIYPKRNM